MKKTSTLLTAAILAVTPLVYADEQSDLVKQILDDLNAVSAAPSFMNEDGEETIPEGIEVIMADPGFMNMGYKPVNIKTNDDNPIYNMRLCRVINPKIMDAADLDSDPIGSKRVMADFPVTAKLRLPDDTEVTDTVDFVHPGFMSAPPYLGGGFAGKLDLSKGYSWFLIQHGKETWDKHWSVHVRGATLLSLTIDPIAKKGNPKAAFDILLRPNDKAAWSTGHPNPGSGAGWPVQVNRPFHKTPTDVTMPGVIPPGFDLDAIKFEATYSKPIVLSHTSPAAVLGNPHDLYGAVTIDFVVDGQDGIEAHNLTVDLAFLFWTDTDCLPNESSVEATSEGGNSYAVEVRAAPGDIVTLLENGEKVFETSGWLLDTFSYQVKEGAQYEAVSAQSGSIEINVSN